MKGTTKTQLIEFCKQLCAKIGETYVGPCSISADPDSGQPLIAFKGREGWYSVRQDGDHLAITDPEGKPGKRPSGLKFPTLDVAEPQNMPDDPLAHIQPFQSPRLQTQPPQQQARSTSSRARRTTKAAGGSSGPKQPFSPETAILRPDIDEKDVLEIVQKYLVEVHEVHSSLMEKDNTTWLKVEVRGNNMPDVMFVISTNVSGEEESRGITERVVIVRLLTQIRVEPSKREAVLEAVNTYHVFSWAGCFRIHEDHEVEGNWPINTLASGVHVEYVWDAMVRLLSGWKRLYPEISKILYG